MVMNYLAHAFLSKNNKELLIGNFIADHIRGNNFETFSPGIVAGIQLHRRIDTFTDAHPLFKKSKRVFYNGFEKYSGVLVDIYFDHFLAKNFEKHAQIDLSHFSKKVYDVYSSHRHIIPQSSSRFLDYLIQNNVYYSYSQIEGIQTVLNHLSQRIKNKSQLDDSIVLFKQNYDEIESNFDSFFKDVLIEFFY